MNKRNWSQKVHPEGEEAANATHTYDYYLERMITGTTATCADPRDRAHSNDDDTLMLTCYIYNIIYV